MQNVALVGAIRAARSELNVPAGARLPLHVLGASEDTLARLSRNETALSRLARAQPVSTEPAPPGGAAQIVLDEATYVIPLEGVIDLQAERARLRKNADAAVKEIGSIEKRLGNPNFRAKAKPEVVTETEEKLAEKRDERERLEAALARLG